MTNPSSNNGQLPINRDTALEMLVSAFTDLNKQWEAYLKAEYQNFGEERLYYIDIGEIVQYIVEKRKHNDTFGFEEFFSRVETILIYGDSYTSELIVIGLLEGIQNVCGWCEVNYYTGFNEWLKPQTKKAWNELIQFWEGKEPKT